MKFCGGIGYENKNKKSSVGSDICWNCNPDSSEVSLTEEHRKLLHDCLDEWLNESNGTGGFWIGDPEYFVGWGS